MWNFIKINDSSQKKKNEGEELGERRSSESEGRQWGTEAWVIFVKAKMYNIPHYNLNYML